MKLLKKLRLLITILLLIFGLFTLRTTLFKFIIRNLDTYLPIQRCIATLLCILFHLSNIYKLGKFLYYYARLYVSIVLNKTSSEFVCLDSDKIRYEVHS